MSWYKNSLLIYWMLQSKSDKLEVLISVPDYSMVYTNIQLVDRC